MKERVCNLVIGGLAAIAVACVCGLSGCFGDEPMPTPAPTPVPKIILPMTPVLVEPDEPKPAPKPEPEFQPRVIDTLTVDQIWVVESTIGLIVREYPPGIVSIEATDGPIRVRGKFADGSGKTETRDYRSTYVYFVTAETSGSVMLDLVPIGVLAAEDIVRQVLTVSGPRPPPDPGPGPEPDPDPTPGPVTPTKLQIVIIEDPALRGSLPPEQIAIMDGGDLRDYVKTHCVMTNGTPDFRKVSFRQDVSAQPQWIKDAFAEPRPSLPLIVIVTPTQTISGPLPKTIAETMALLKQYGGD